MVGMNPRHRRLLIPALLIALLVVVVIGSILGKAHGAEPAPVSRLRDPRITESSGLAVSSAHPGLAYTVNDSGHALVVYAVEIASGRVVGTTSIDAASHDTEAVALSHGTLWIADTGSNTQRHPAQALIAIAEPGTGTHRVAGRRYPITIPGEQNTEALLADPTHPGRLYLVTKEAFGGALAYRVDPGRGVVTQVAGAGLPSLVTDGSFSPDGSTIVLLTYTSVVRVDPATWRQVGSSGLPPLRQAESLAFVGNHTLLVGSEGADSPLYEIGVPAATSVGSSSAAVRSAGATSSTGGVADDSGRAALVVIAGAAGVVAVSAIVLVARGRRHARATV